MTNTTHSSSRIGFAAGAATLLVLSVLPYSAQADILFRELDQGMSGADVSVLQKFLATDITIYPQGLVTGFFGPLTFSAVSNFQSRNNIATVGRVGPVTLAAINRLSGSIGGSSDVNAPAIRGVTYNTSASSATITWTTNEGTLGTLYYSPSWITLTENQAANPDGVSISGTPVVSTNSGYAVTHSASVQNLQANTTYYYAIHATDAVGNVSATWPATFKTNQ